MKNISKIGKRKNWEILVWAEILKNIKKTESNKHFIDAFDRLLSEKEKKLIAKRIIVISMIKAGKNYREIGKVLWISPKTISAIKKSMGDDKGYKSSHYYSERSSEEKRKKIKPLREQTIFDYWANFPFPESYYKGRWKYLNYQG